MASGSMQWENSEGLQLVEIINIIYKGKKKLKPEEQLGKIEIVTDDGIQYVYNVDKVDESMSTIEYLDNILITPKGPIWNEITYIDMHYNLFNGLFKGSLRLDVDPLNSCEDEAIEEEVISSGDSTEAILVRLARYFHSTVANLEVRLLSEDGSALQNVCGVISATNSRRDFPFSETLLFAKKPGQGIDLQPNGVIPLLKSRIALPLGSELYVDFCLNVNGVAVNGTETFQVSSKGLFPNITPQKTKNPKIQVTVEGFDDEESLTLSYDIVGPPAMPWD